jgi:uncharacterized membrane protein
MFDFLIRKLGGYTKEDVDDIADAIDDANEFAVESRDATIKELTEMVAKLQVKKPVGRPRKATYISKVE